MKSDHQQFPEDFEPPFPPAKHPPIHVDLDFLDNNKVNSGTPYRPSTKSWDD